MWEMLKQEALAERRRRRLETTKIEGAGRACPERSEGMLPTQRATERAKK
ncbi:hypothetical protein SBA2_280016 [Acidobacteriia bacterium SbA2]|nr:hypothetical protein SBA2_280016 [Acidobacteriia bacterium SbA2]